MHCRQFVEQAWHAPVDVIKNADLQVVHTVELLQTLQLAGQATHPVFNLAYPAKHAHDPDDKTLPAAHVRHAEVVQDVQEKLQLMHEVPLRIYPLAQLHLPLAKFAFELQTEQTPLLQVVHNTSQDAVVDVQTPEALNENPVLHEQVRPLATALISLQVVHAVSVHAEQVESHLYWHELPEYPESQIQTPFVHTPYPLQPSKQGIFSQRILEAGQVTFPKKPVTETGPPVNGQTNVADPIFTVAPVVEHEVTS